MMRYGKKTAALVFLCMIMAVCMTVVGKTAGAADDARHADPVKMTWVCGRENNVPIGLTDGKQNFAGVIYSSEDPSLIRVTEKTGRLGIVESEKTKRSGKTRIVLSYGGKRYYCTVKKVDPKISHTKLNLVLGSKNTAQLKMSDITDVNNKPLPCVWNSTDQSVAIVKNGKVTAMKPGTTNITCTVDQQVTYTCAVRVSKVNVTSIVLDTGALSLVQGTEGRLEAAVSPKNATSQELVWRTDNKWVAGVDQEGVVTAYGPGTAVVTVCAKEDDSVAAVCVVTVTERAAAEITDTEAAAAKAADTEAANAEAADAEVANAEAAAAKAINANATDAETAAAEPDDAA